MLIRLLLTTKSFRRTLLNHFISKVLYDSFSFRCFGKGTTSSPSSLRLFLPNLLLRMRRNGHSCPLALTFYKLKFSVPGFVHNLSFGLVLSHFNHF